MTFKLLANKMITILTELLYPVPRIVSEPDKMFDPTTFQLKPKE